VVRGDNLFGRGASDDKGQMFTHVKAAECLLRTTGSLPVNVKCVFEGEEEIGSTNLPAFLRRHCDAIAADVAVLSDNRMLGPDRPVITESLRGGLSAELQVRGHDLHSGNFGGAVHNPLQALCEILAGLHGTGGRISIPGFYDRVRELRAKNALICAGLDRRTPRSSPMPRHQLAGARLAIRFMSAPRFGRR
jgi:acetylornithine deacetylase/succinyl-diaminopimelate desuccinylase-like protein